MWINQKQDIEKLSFEDLIRYHNHWRPDNQVESFPNLEAAKEACYVIREEHWQVFVELSKANPEMSTVNVRDMWYRQMNGIKEVEGVVKAVVSDVESVRIYKARKRKAAIEQEQQVVADRLEDGEISEEEALAEIRAMAKRKVEDRPIFNGRQSGLSSESLVKSWANPTVAKARATRHNCKVTVDDKTAIYRSVRQAFDDLGLPIEKHIRFRMQLKESGKLAYQFDGKTYVFEAVLAESRTYALKGKIETALAKHQLAAMQAEEEGPKPKRFEDMTLEEKRAAAHAHNKARWEKKQ